MSSVIPTLLQYCLLGAVVYMYAKYPRMDQRKSGGQMYGQHHRHYGGSFLLVSMGTRDGDGVKGKRGGRGAGRGGSGGGGRRQPHYRAHSSHAFYFGDEAELDEKKKSPGVKKMEKAASTLPLSLDGHVDLGLDAYGSLSSTSGLSKKQLKKKLLRERKEKESKMSSTDPAVQAPPSSTQNRTLENHEQEQQQLWQEIEDLEYQKEEVKDELEDQESDDCYVNDARTKVNEFETENDAADVEGDSEDEDETEIGEEEKEEEEKEDDDDEEEEEEDEEEEKRVAEGVHMEEVEPNDQVDSLQFVPRNPHQHPHHHHKQSRSNSTCSTSSSVSSDGSISAPVTIVGILSHGRSVSRGTSVSFGPLDTAPVLMTKSPSSTSLDSASPTDQGPEPKPAVAALTTGVKPKMAHAQTDVDQTTAAAAAAHTPPVVVSSSKERAKDRAQRRPIATNLPSVEPASSPSTTTVAALRIVKGSKQKAASATSLVQSLASATASASASETARQQRRFLVDMFPNVPLVEIDDTLQACDHDMDRATEMLSRQDFSWSAVPRRRSIPSL